MVFAAGLEVISASGAKELEWRNWEPGGSYPKKIIVRNISKKTLKFKYKIPGTKYFMMPFPEPTVLCAGMTKVVDITFRPVKKEQYADVVEFRTADGVLSVPIRATLKEIRLEVPEDLLDFGFCPVNETETRVFVVKNTGELDAPFRWDSKPPFKFEPATGVIKPGKPVTIAAKYSPITAKAINATAIMAVGEAGILRYPKQMKGISKFVHVTASTDSLDFGNIFVGRSVEKTVILQNTTAVKTSFKVRRLEKTYDRSFVFDPKQGVIPAGGSVTLKVKYSALTAGFESADTLELTTPGGNTVTIRCRGRAMGPSIHLSTTSVNFGQVELSSKSMRVITVYNTSDTSAKVHFNVQPDGAFTFSRTDLELNPKSSQHVTLHFVPKHPINYYHRVELMALQAAPLHIDLVGNGYTHETRPAPLWQRHVIRQRRREARGVAKYPPELMESVLLERGQTDVDADLDKQEDADLSVEKKKTHRTEAQDRQRIITDAAKDIALDVKAETEGFGPNRPQTGVGEFAIQRMNHRDEKAMEQWNETFHSQTAEDRDVSLSSVHVDLGSVSLHKAVDPGSVLFHNRTLGKVTCTWLIPESSGGSKGMVPVFQIIPEVADVAPQSTYQFKIVFNPSAENQAYGAILECLVNYKTMRNFRLVNEKTLAVPWRLPLYVSGTSTQDNERFTPDVEIEPQRMQFPQCHVGANAFQSFLMRNTGDTVVTYRLTAAEPFSVNESTGLIPAHSVAIVGVRFNPRDTRPWARTIRCVFNGNPDTAQEVQVVGRGERGVLQILAKGPSKSDLFFRHTCLGTTSKQPLFIFNPSRLHLSFRWQIPKRLEHVFVPTPAHGVLRPYQGLEMEWKFAPTSNKELSVAVPCTFRPARAIDAAAEALDQHMVGRDGRVDTPLASLGSPEEGMEVLKITASGVEGALSLTPNNLELGVVTVFTAAKRTISIRNMTNGKATYFVAASCQTIDDNDEPVADIAVEPSSGVLAPRATAELRISVTPRQALRERDGDVLQCVVESHVLSEEEVVKQQEEIMERRAQSLKARSKKKNRKPLTEAQRNAILDAPLNFHAPEGLKPVSACLIHGHSDHPFLVVKDVRGSGIPSSRLWNQCNIPELNTHLAKPSLSQFEALIGDESRARKKTDQAREVLALRKELAVVSMNLSSGEAGQDDTCYDFELFNTGLIPATFRFVTPNKLEPQMEHWADMGLPTGDDLHQDFIEEHRIFQIQPHKGTLAPGESSRVRLVYSHRFPGAHSVNIHCSVKLGHQVLLQLTGQTLPVATRRLEIGPGTTLCPVAIGTQKPMVQTLELRNPGTQDAYFDVDTTPLRLLAKDNYDIPVIECLSPSGIVRPGMSEWVAFIFRPIEVKEYSVALPLLVRDEDGEPFPLVYPTPREVSVYNRVLTIIKSESVDQRTNADLPALPTLPVIVLRGVGYNPMVAKLPLPGGQTRFGAISRLSLNPTPLPALETESPFAADEGEDESTFIAHVMTARRVAMEPIEESQPPPSGNEGIMDATPAPSQSSLAPTSSRADNEEDPEAAADSERAREHLVQTVTASLNWPPPMHQTLGVAYSTDGHASQHAVKITDQAVGRADVVPALLSLERLDFGVIPTHTKAARLVAVRNVSASDTIRFEWNTAIGACGNNFSVYPRSGRLHPGTHTLCRASLDAGTRTAVWSFHAVCIITNETKQRMAEQNKQAAIEARNNEDELFAAEGQSPGRIPPRPSARARPARKMVSDRASTIARERARHAKLEAAQSKKNSETLPAGVTLGLGWTAAMRSDSPTQALAIPEQEAVFNDMAATNRGFALPGSPDPHPPTASRNDAHSGVLHLLVEAMVDDVKTFDRESHHASVDDPAHGMSLSMTPAPGDIFAEGTRARQGSPVQHQSSPRAPYQSSARTAPGQRHSLNDFFVSLATPASVPGGPAVAAREAKKPLPAEHKAILEAVMEDIVRDLSKDRSTAEVYEALFREPVPYFEQLVQPHADDEHAATSASEAAEAQAPDPATRHWELARADPLFTQVTEEIIENTLLNLMSEASHREFNLVQPPKFLVKK